MIDLKRLEQLVSLMVEHDLSELDIREQDEAISLKRGFAPQTGSLVPAGPPSAAGHDLSHGTAGRVEPAGKEDEGLLAIESPMVGTFYSKPKPDAESFTRVGAQVGKDTVVCLIEAMKVFNEVQAGVSGKIERMLVENGDPVEFGQKLFLVRPN